MREPLVSADVHCRLVQALHFFFYCLDERRYDDLVALFTENGVWNRQGERLQGHASIRRALDARSPTQRIRHVLTNVFVAGRSDGLVTLKAYMTAYRHDDGTPTVEPPRIAGPLRMSLLSTTFEQAGDGWLIAEQTLTPEFEFNQG